MTTKASGLDGVIVDNTAISTVSKEGVGLTYRGYDIDDLVRHSTFEEVAYLLIYSELPTQSQLQNYRDRLVKLRRIPNELKLLLETIPGDAHPMEVLRTGVSMIGTIPHCRVILVIVAIRCRFLFALIDNIVYMVVVGG